MTTAHKIDIAIAAIILIAALFVGQHFYYEHLLEKAQAENAATTKQLTVTADQLAAANIAASKQQAQETRKTVEKTVRQQVHEEASSSDLVDYINDATGNR